MMNELIEASMEAIRLAARHSEACERRDELIRQALAAGMTHQQVADETGLTRGRIGQIAGAHRTA